MNDATIDLLGVLAYGELTAFFKLSSDAELAPTLSAKTALARIAADELVHHEQIRAHLGAAGVDADAAMQPFVSAFEEFHERTAPSTWFEGLVKAYVGDGFAADFYHKVAELTDAETQAVVVRAVDSQAREDFLVNSIKAGIAADPSLSHRLALWARRIMGEALSQGHRVAATRPALGELILNSSDSDQASITRLTTIFGDLTSGHMERMARLGLDA